VASGWLGIGAQIGQRLKRRFLFAGTRGASEPVAKACRQARKPVLHLWFWLLLLFPLAGALRAQTSTLKGYLIEGWPTERGLPQNTVTGIAQTRDGYLWISTLDGLARFDGLRFKLYKAGNTPALGSGRIRFLFEGRHGELWLATQEGGVVRWQDGQFTALPLPDVQGTRSAVIQVAEDNTGGLWLSTEDGKVARIKDGRYSAMSTNWDPTGKMAFQVRADAQGQLLATSDFGVYHVNGERVLPALQGRRGEYVVHCASRRGGWWLSAGDQVRLWRGGQWVATFPGPRLPASEVRSGLEDHTGHLWLGTWRNGLFRCSTNGALLQFTKRDGLGSDFVRALCEDGEGNLWAGTVDGGLNRLRLPLFKVYGLAEGLSWEWITSVSESPDGELWVGTDGYGLNRLQGDMIRPVGDPGAISPLHVMTALADRQRQVWLGTRQGGLFQWKTGAAVRITDSPTNSSFVRSFYEDSHGTIWVGRRDTDRLLRVEQGRLSSLELPKSVGLVDVRVMVEDAAGALWIGTDGSGVLRWKDGQFGRFTRENGLGSDLIWALQPERDGSLWIGSFGGGLTRLKNGSAVTCTTFNGLMDDVICFIADDGQGQYWMSSHQGVFRVAKNELNQFADGTIRTVHCVGYGKSDGLPTLECRGGFQPAGCRGRDGELWFPTVGGVVVVDPADANTTTVAPPVHIEEVFVDGQLFEKDAWSAADGRRDGVPGSASALPRSPSLAFPAGSRRFEFHYAGVALGAPEGLRFRHKLEGVDADWVETGNRRDASYNRLSHGTYTFRVQTCNREGIWGQPGDAVSFSVLPYSWQTWWFIGLFLLTFGTAVAWGVGWALRRRHQHRLMLVQQLHAAERERTRIARDIHDDLGSSLTEIGLLGALAVRESTPPAEVREQVGRIMERAEELARKLDETVWAVNPSNDSLKHLATYLCNHAKDFLEPTAIRCRLDVAANLPDSPLAAEVRHNVFLVAKEALNNAVRHSGASEIELRMAVNEGVFTLEVKDNGHGFAADAKPETGNGLRNMAERTREIGGQFEARSTPGQGTTICLRLPVAHEISDAPGHATKRPRVSSRR
jgi:signal transduction histidine kinase/ligand-binding sensor domain-containing protein